MKEIEQKIRKHLAERGWDKLKPGDLSKSVMIEGAELLELFQWDNPTLEQVRKNEELLKLISNELADVLIYALEISVMLGFDTRKVITQKLEAVAKKYPVEIFNKNSAGSKATKRKYLEIKKKHRRERN